jgi:hypothetical protein
LIPSTANTNAIKFQYEKSSSMKLTSPTVSLFKKQNKTKTKNVYNTYI